MKRTTALLAFALIFGCGCSGGSKDSQAESTTPTKSAGAMTSESGTKPPPETPGTQPKPADSTAGTSGDKTPESPSTSTDSASKEIPSSLKTLAYEYEGLGNPKPMDMEETVTGKPGVTTGSQTTTLKEVKDGKATYTIERTGGLADLGTDEASLEPDGVYIKSSSLASFSSHAMDLPADPTPGKTWSYHIKSDNAAAMFDLDTKCKIVGFEDVTTKGGSYKGALVVEQEQTGTMQHKKVRTVSKSWYVKGMGTVKAEQKVFLANGTTQSITVQEAKHS